MLVRWPRGRKPRIWGKANGFLPDTGQVLCVVHGGSRVMRDWQRHYPVLIQRIGHQSSVIGQAAVYIWLTDVGLAFQVC